MTPKLNVTRPTHNPRDALREENVQTVYDFIVSFFKQYGYSPTIQEIAESALISRTQTVRYMDILVARNYILRHHNIPRSISLVDPEDRL